MSAKHKRRVSFIVISYNRPMKKKKVIKILGMTFAVVIIGYALLSPSINPVAKMMRLNYLAQKKAEELSSINIVSGFSTAAVKQVDGDILTASADTYKSAYAQARIELNSSFNQLYSDVSLNLKKAGFIIQGEPAKPYYDTASNGPKFSSINTRYINRNKSISITYVLDKTYTCPEGYTCKFDSNTTATQKTALLTSSFDTYIVKEIDVIYRR